jgi:hypothetical protein
MKPTSDGMKAVIKVMIKNELYSKITIIILHG